MTTWNPHLPGVVTLPDGRRVRGRGLSAETPQGELAPEFALYLTARPHSEPGWESRWVRWPDFRLPRDTDDAVDAIRDAYSRAGSAKVEIACAGGTGRTGSAMAMLARLAGIPSADAVAWVRAHYRPRAVETRRQRQWVARTPLR